jgi:multidrug resistance efflux pump
MLKWFVLILSICGATLGVSLAFRKPLVYAAQEKEPPVRNPFEKGFAGAGLIEPASEAIIIGVAEPGQVSNVWIKKGQLVKKGDPLFKTDTRALENQLIVLEADVKSAQAELERVKAYRRKEDEPLLRAKVASQEAAVLEAQTAVRESKLNANAREWMKKDQEAKLRRLTATVKAGASSEEERERVEFALNTAGVQWQSALEAVAAAEARVHAASAALDQSKAELQTYLAGAWAPDVARSEAAVEVARAKVEQTKREIERRTVRAPIDATVIRLNLREGEFAATGAQLPENAPVVLGDMTSIHVRIDIDEFEAGKFKPGMQAKMFLRSDRSTPIALDYVGVEPYIIPKRSLTNSQRELVDTRVLQVIYRIQKIDAGMYVGQQVDVYFDLTGAQSTAQK